MIDAPKTLDEALARRYRKWAGNPKGNLFNPSRCAFAAHDGGSSVLTHQCFKSPGHGAGQLYCRQHAKKVPA